MEVTRGLDQVGSSDAPRRRTALGTGTSEQWLSVLYFLYFCQSSPRHALLAALSSPNQLPDLLTHEVVVPRSLPFSVVWSDHL